MKFPQISERMVSQKSTNIADSKADALLGGDLGCLLNMAGRLQRTGSTVSVYHTAEVLADMAHLPGIGSGDSDSQSSSDADSKTE